MKTRRLTILPAILLLAGMTASAGQTQEAVSPGRKATEDPTTAMRDLLSAACAQNQKEFGKYFTARNARAYGQLSTGSKIALMKRFVLLDEVGKPRVEVNPAGRPTVVCETPAATNELQIGGADTQDNLAFLPLEVRATGSARAEARRTEIGLVREYGEWKLMSLGLILLDLPVLGVEWERANLSGNEQEAIVSLKKIAQAVETYRRTYARLPRELKHLGQAGAGGPSAEAAGLLDAELAGGAKDGYAFRYVIEGASAVGAPARYELAATPMAYGTTGRRSFFRDASGRMHGADRQGGLGSASDPRVE